MPLSLGWHGLLLRITGMSIMLALSAPGLLIDNDLCDSSNGEAMSTVHALELSLLGRLLPHESELKLLALLKPTPESIDDPLVE